ncbi:MAG: LysR family transcriptional regulator [Alphaproteobacteria bacterium]|nr:LysR family transcriptional regulator [Alphaproteobacteria bacterium]
MDRLDLNLLHALVVLLEEESVTRAAARMGLSDSAMSRQLARLRETTGDPLLQRAGRRLVPTPRAQAIRARACVLLEQAEGLMRPTTLDDLRALSRTFRLQTGDGFVETFGAALLERIAREAPGVRVLFVPPPPDRSEALRTEAVDLMMGVVGDGVGPEIRTRTVFRDAMVGVVAPAHPFAAGPVTVERFAAARHIETWRHAQVGGPVDRALAAVGLSRTLHVVVPGFSAAIALARAGVGVTTVPARHTAGLLGGLCTFTLPMPLPAVPVALLWHPRNQSDPAHRWLRGCVFEVCADGS